jgi:hypothetical protein
VAAFACAACGPERATPEGEQRWEQRIPDVDAWYVDVAPDGSIYVLGGEGPTVMGDGATYDAMWLGKLAADGMRLWEVREADALPVGLTAGAAGEAAIGYRAEIETESRTAFRVHRADSTVQWMMDVDIGSFAIAPNGDVVLAAYVQDGTASVLERYDASGASRWSRPAEATAGSVYLSAITFASDGDLVFAGATSNVEAWVTRADQAGEPRWKTTLTTGATSAPIIALELADDATIFGMSTAGGVDGPFVMALGTDGAELWRRALPQAPDSDETLHRALAQDGGSVALGGRIGGTCSDPFSVCYDAITITRFDPHGEVLWHDERTDCRGPQGITIAPDGTVVVLASCEGATTRDTGILVYEP